MCAKGVFLYKINEINLSVGINSLQLYLIFKYGFPNLPPSNMDPPLIEFSRFFPSPTLLFGPPFIKHCRVYSLDKNLFSKTFFQQEGQFSDKMIENLHSASKLSYESSNIQIASYKEREDVNLASFVSSISSGRFGDSSCLRFSTLCRISLDLV